MTTNHSDIKWDRLVAEIAHRTSKQWLAKHLQVSSKEVARWISDPSTSKPRIPHYETQQRIIAAAEHLNITWRVFAELMPAFEFGRSFYLNKAKGPQALPAPVRDIPHLPTSLAGHKLNSPFGLSASLLTADSRWIDEYLQRGFDVITYHTVRTTRIDSHAAPNAVYIPSLTGPIRLEDIGQPVYASSDPPDGESTSISLATSFGAPSSDPKEWQRDMQITLGKLSPGQILIASILGSESGERSIEDDFVLCAQLAHEVAPHALELNFGCRVFHNNSRQTVTRDISLAQRIVERIRRELPTAKLFLKLDLLSPDRLALVFEATYLHVDGYTAIAPVPMQVVSKGQREDDAAFPSQYRATPGISGAAIRELALGMVEQLNQLRSRKPSLDIIATGGISCLEHARTFFEVGANAVQFTTAAIFNPAIAIELRKGFASEGYTEAPHNSERGSANFRLSGEDEVVEKALELTNQVCRELGMPLGVGIAALNRNWLDHYNSDIAKIRNSGDPLIRTRRSLPQKHQLRQWILREKANRR